MVTIIKGSRSCIKYLLGKKICCKFRCSYFMLCCGSRTHAPYLLCDHKEQENKLYYSLTLSQSWNRPFPEPICLPLLEQVVEVQVRGHCPPLQWRSFWPNTVLWKSYQSEDLAQCLLWIWEGGGISCLLVNSNWGEMKLLCNKRQLINIAPLAWWTKSSLFLSDNFHPPHQIMMSDRHGKLVYLIGNSASKNREPSGLR